MRALKATVNHWAQAGQVANLESRLLYLAIRSFLFIPTWLYNLVSFILVAPEFRREKAIKQLTDRYGSITICYRPS